METEVPRNLDETKTPENRVRRVILFSIALSVFFCGGFAFVCSKYVRAPAPAGQENSPLMVTGALVGRHLPEVDFIDAQNKHLTSASLGQGKVVIVVVSHSCSACGDERDFLKSVLGQKTSVKFYGLLTYSDIRDLPTDTDKYPFKLLYDRSGKFIQEFGIDRTPVKLFCDGGVVRKIWVGSTTDETGQTNFSNWLRSMG